MKQESKDFLFELLNTPSPTGHEQHIQKVVRAYMEPYADIIEADLHGNLIVGLSKADSLKAISKTPTRRVMLAGHCDQIGFLVNDITDKGFLKIAPLGGIDKGTLWGARVEVLTKSGPIPGVIGRKAIHLQSAEERKKGLDDFDKLWVDIGMSSKAQVEKKIQIGDPLVFTPDIVSLGKNLICGPGLDDRVGLFVVMETLKSCSRKKLNVDLYSVSTVQEEIGLRGARTAAYTIDPEVGLAVDVTHATDYPHTDASKTPRCELGKGPTISRGVNTNLVVEKMLHDSAIKSKVKHQISHSGRPLGNDANAIQVTRGGVAAASIGIPNRYMHTQVEVCDLRDLSATVKLLTQFICSIKKDTDFRPC